MFRALRISPLERVTSAFIPSSLIATLKGNRQKGHRGPWEHRHSPRERDGLEWLRLWNNERKKGKEGVNNPLLIDLEFLLVFRDVGFTLVVTAHSKSRQTLILGPSIAMLNDQFWILFSGKGTGEICDQSQSTPFEISSSLGGLLAWHLITQNAMSQNLPF